MSRYETVTSATVPGAARRYSYSFPALFDNLTLNANGTVGNTFERARGTSQAASFNYTMLGAPPAVRGGTFYKGRCCVAWTSNTGSGFHVVPNTGAGNAMLIPYQNVKGPANLAGLDDWACWSVSLIAAYDVLPGPVTGDIGLVLGVGTRNVIRGSNQFAGVEFGPTDVGAVGVFCRQTDAGPVSFNQNILNPPDVTLWNKYEIRIVGPTDVSEAQLKFYVNNTLKLSLPYGAGTVLPDPHVIGGAGNMGTTPCVINREACGASTARMYVPANAVTVCAGPTEASLI